MLGLIFCLEFGDSFVSQSPSEFWVSLWGRLWFAYSIIFLFLEFFSLALAVMVSHWSLRDSKSPQVSRTLLSILADLNNAVVWMVSTRSLIVMSSSSFTNLLVTVPRSSITIGITATLMFHSFLISLARSRYLSFFSLSFNFPLWSVGTAKSTIRQILFFLLKSGRLGEIRWSLCISKFQKRLCMTFSRTDSGLWIYP